MTSAAPSPAPTPAKPAPAKQKLSPGLKTALEMGPPLLFLVANFRPKPFLPLLRPFVPEALLTGDQAGLVVGTIVLMAATVLSLLVSYAKTRHLPMVPVVTALMVLVFGGLTVYFRDKSFIQIKVTIIYVMFGLVLLGGLAFKRPLLPVLLESAMSLTERGWSVLTLRWGVFFLSLAGLNEVMRHALTWDHWLFFKFPGTMILIFVFTFSQVPFMMRHELKGEEAERAPEHF